MADTTAATQALNQRPVKSFAKNMKARGSRIAKAIELLKQKLTLANLTKLKPVFYFSDEWFCLEGSVAIAVPYYLASPALLVEHRRAGKLPDSRYALIKYLLHETGHAFDGAYGLMRLKKSREIFGNGNDYVHATQTFKKDKGYKKNRFIAVIDPGYAAVHPDEDFAETFAYIILNPGWRRQHRRGDVVFRKLLYMERLIKKYGQKKQKKRDTGKMNDIARSKKSVGAYIAAIKR